MGLRPGAVVKGRAADDPQASHRRGGRRLHRVARGDVRIRRREGGAGPLEVCLVRGPPECGMVRRRRSGGPGCAIVRRTYTARTVIRSSTGITSSVTVPAEHVRRAANVGERCRRAPRQSIVGGEGGGEGNSVGAPLLPLDEIGLHRSAPRQCIKVASVGGTRRNSSPGVVGACVAGHRAQAGHRRPGRRRDGVAGRRAGEGGGERRARVLHAARGLIRSLSPWVADGIHARLRGVRRVVAEAGTAVTVGHGVAAGASTVLVAARRQLARLVDRIRR